jgi:hypothetical protein
MISLDMTTNGICYVRFNESFKCKRYTFLCCPKSFNRYYSADNNNNPIDRYLKVFRFKAIISCDLFIWDLNHGVCMQSFFFLQ